MVFLRLSTKIIYERKIKLTIGEGENFGFLGPNGAGKTTIICILTGRAMVARFL
jgi:ABC-type multidrug transport system ATPase subunit